VPKMVQYREPFLNGTLLEVGFGKSFAYKLYILSVSLSYCSLRSAKYCVSKKNRHNLVGTQFIVSFMFILTFIYIWIIICI